MDIETNLEKLTIEDKPLYKILVVDVGIKHMGLCLAFVDYEYIIEKIVDFNLIDITRYTHNNCEGGYDACKLHHTKTCWDWLEHVFMEHPCFGQADIILIERQPIVGITCVEQIIFGKYRSKTHLISPNNVHKFLRIAHLDYEKRKKFSEAFGMKYLSEEQQKELLTYERAHDITDAIEMLVYWTNKKHSEKIRQEYLESQQKEYTSTFERLESFRYRGGNINLVQIPIDII